MDAICEELKKHNISSCSILFDMLLCRGNTSERFTEVFFDRDRIVKESIKYVKIDKDSEIRKISANFMRDINITSTNHDNKRGCYIAIPFI